MCFGTHFLALTFGVSAILGRYHYTIDVVAAPFMAYGVFALCRAFFMKYKLEPFAT